MPDLLTALAVYITDRKLKNDLKRMEDSNMTYKLMKRIIVKGGYDRENTMLKLDVFLIADRITAEEYQELAELMGASDE